MDEKTLVGGLRMGSRWANELGSVLGKDDSIGLWPDEQLCIALIVYAAALAASSKLDEDDFVQFTQGAYRGVELTRNESRQVRRQRQRKEEADVDEDDVDDVDDRDYV